MAVSQVLRSDSPSFALIAKHPNGEKVGEAILVKLLLDFLNFYNIGKTMNENQVVETVKLLIQDYAVLKPDDFVLFFNRAKKGNYGKVYDRMDGQIIFEWMESFMQERIQEIEAIRINEKKQLEKAEKEELKAVPMPDYIKQLIVKKTPEPEKPRELVQTDQQKQISEWIIKFDELWKAEGSKGGKKFVTINSIKMDLTEYLYFKAGYTEMGL